ncbi:DUF2273 domain-containing protein [Alicyclobacillus mali]|uniref:DUF2273 domain-containing protein n=2 Tax=Alicyclobacillus mali (ex Roth et al. 2021) TaxID=1123961 RepID=A0ABS0F5X7_9BACL|nr:DUF2273 domain-containing protein [Alicyclobacillus mali (ex Roth et al. 2021)]MBF8378709.1 DUF2273 domain-containing protein [Alicyclobacillus mali (ex Roth et al. 2021)]MCL6487734.1 DUF2273 domain-containing protein [Alicyclobacillus mali (ex Roth et al. 2021)]
MNGLERAWQWFIGRPRRYHGLAAGVLFWILWMIFGFWRVLLLFVLAGVGYAGGRAWEEQQSWRRILERLLTDRYTE